ncbi:MAG TPA: hypothetical protein VFA93_01170 [Patescibacteria group bacterium]|nr:hypothetical protein [Patescibacteria group bacterium]
MKINFYPEHDDLALEEATKKYAKIWKEEEERIIKVLEKLSGLKFKEKFINAIIYDEPSWSHPLKLDCRISDKLKRGVLVHELIHRLFKGNSKEKLKIPFSKNNYILDVHKLLDLILFDAWVELYDEDFAKDQITYEINLWNREGISPYKVAWDWVLKMTKEQRAEEFKKHWA